MSLRLTDTEKWREPWYMDLPPIYKLLWNYIYDRCDNSGVWIVNVKLAEFEIGSAIDWRESLERFQQRVEPLDNGLKWHLKNFIAIQHPHGIDTDSKVHAQVRRLLAEHGIFYETHPTPIPLGRDGGGSLERPRSVLDKIKTLPSISKGGGAGGGPIIVADFLAEFGIPNGVANVREWKGGLKNVLKASSAGETRAWMAWALGIIEREKAPKQYWRHFASLAEEWNRRRHELWKETA